MARSAQSIFTFYNYLFQLSTLTSSIDIEAYGGLDQFKRFRWKKNMQNSIKH